MVYLRRGSGKMSGCGSGRVKPHGSNAVFGEVVLAGSSSLQRQEPGWASGVSRKVGFRVAGSPPDDLVLLHGARLDRELIGSLGNLKN